jgi:hypothetical protein
MRTPTQEPNKDVFNSEEFTDHHERNQSSPSCKTDNIYINELIVWRWEFPSAAGGRLKERLVTALVIAASQWLSKLSGGE